MSQLSARLSQYWDKIQGTLFPWLEEELDPLTEKQQQLITILEVVRIEKYVPTYFGCEGRPQKTRPGIARAYIAKMVYNFDTTLQLLERLQSDKSLRRICGWEYRGQIPSESTFSRAFAEFAKTALPDRVLQALIDKTLKMYWHGYKLHLDTVDGDIPVRAIVTSASVHDSQVAIPLATLTARNITSCYDLMDSAYDVPGIIEHSKKLGHVPLIDKNPRGNKELQKMLQEENLARKTLNFTPAELVRYNARSGADRVNSRLNDEFGATRVRVRGWEKVICHLLFGVLALAADQLMK